MTKTIPKCHLALVALVLLASCARSPTPVPAPTPAADIAVLAGAFLQAIDNGDWSAAIQSSDANMKMLLPPEKLRSVWDSLSNQFGPLRRFGATRIEKAGAYDSVYVVCEFENAVLDAKVVFDSQKRVSGLWFVPHQNDDYHPPPYVSAASFRDEDTTVGSGASSLPVTLSIPDGQDLLPAVVLVHGSGPNDRDETVGACKPFRDLAWGLASQGIAVLRYDKRTRVFPQEMAALQQTLTVAEEVIADAVAAVTALRNNPIINPARVFVLGHSLGGSLAPRIAAAYPSVAGLVIMAGATRPLEDLVLDQTLYLAELDGSISSAEQLDLNSIKLQVQAVKDANLSAESAPDGLLGAPAAYWLDLREYRPAEAAAALDHPLLVLQGERDYQVTLQDYDGWRKALEGRANAAFQLFSGLNHLFVAGEGKSTPAEYDLAGHVDQEVVNTIATWIHEH